VKFIIFVERTAYFPMLLDCFYKLEWLDIRLPFNRSNLFTAKQRRSLCGHALLYCLLTTVCLLTL